MQDTTHNKLLLFQVGPVKCSLYSDDIQTIIPPPKQETAGKTGRLPGMFRHSERLIRVIDVRAKFGLSPSDPLQGRLIISELPHGTFAFWVDKVLNVIDQEDGRWDILPAALPRDVFTRTFIMEQELILHTECARLAAMTPSVGLTQHIEQLQARAEQAKAPATVARVAAPVTTATKPPATPERPEPAQIPPAPPVTPRPAEPPRPSTVIKPTAPRPVPPAPTPRPASPPPSRTTATPAARTETRPTTRTVQATDQRSVPAGRPPQAPQPSPTVSSARTPDTGGTQTTTPASTSLPRTAVPPPPRPSFATAASPPPLPRQNPPDEGGGMFWLMAIMLLLFIAGSGALLYYSGSFDTPGAPPPVARYEEPVPPSVAPPEPVTFIEPEPAPLAVIPEPEQTDTDVVAPATGGQTDSATEGYRASIDKQDRVVTITLEGAEGDALRPLETLEEEGADAPASAAETDITVVPEAETEAEPIVEPTPEPMPEPVAEPVSKPAKTRNMVTHVVVKGDTLWDIAERYVKDPFRYPELARLSGIKDPDRIYPGDIVQIIAK